MGSVYKYLSFKYGGFLDDGFLRFTQPVALNDPYECLAAFPDLSPEEQAADLFSGALDEINFSVNDAPNVKSVKLEQIRTAVRRIRGMAEENPNFLRDFSNKTNYAKINKGLGILSLSRRWNSALMWSHYTETYRGYCVGFNKEHSFFEEVNIGGELKRTSLLPVKYSKKRTIVPQRQDQAPGLDIFLTKSTDWAYEEEDRLLALLIDADKTKDLKPHKVHLFKMPLDAISEIVLGHNAPESLRIDVLEAGKRLGVPVYRTKISSRSFDVEREDLVGGIYI
ncbi:DUF2971 domain-containing protein [Pseudomonas synxantha]|nr:DUF2971 domain-containing protein [Pseudomonas synxantha]